MWTDHWLARTVLGEHHHHQNLNKHSGCEQDRLADYIEESDRTWKREPLIQDFSTDAIDTKKMTKSYGSHMFMVLTQ